MLLTPITSLPALIGDAIQVLIILVFVHAIIANIRAFGGRVSMYNPFVKFVYTVVEPILTPVRRLVPPGKTQGWDLSPLLVLFVLQWLRSYFY